MRYVNETDIKEIGIEWNDVFDQIEHAIVCLSENDYAQPKKPYLRYRNPRNRIIAMPAFLGGRFNVSGIKWIASFPDNLEKKIPRAHSVVVLNNADTGEPVGIINTALLSIVRTAGVSGVMLKHFDKARGGRKFNLGIIGWGPIGRYHLKMCTEVFGDAVSDIFLYDVKGIDAASIELPAKNRVHIAPNWQEVYDNSDVFITCTVSKERYVDKRPRDGSLLLNVSLRDFKIRVFEWVKDAIIVDDWDEVCRENTDVEMMHLEKGLEKAGTKSIVDVVIGNCLGEYDDSKAVMFNPMGMAVFDIAIGNYYLSKALERNVGMDLQ